MKQVCKCGCTFELITPAAPTQEELKAVSIDLPGIEKYLDKFTPRIRLTLCDGHYLQVASLGKREVELR